MYTRIVIVSLAVILCLPFAVIADCHDDYDGPQYSGKELSKK